MNNDLTNPIVTIIFFVVIGFLILISLLTAFVFIRYGRKPHFTIAVTLIFSVLFILGAATAFATLQNLF